MKKIFRLKKDNKMGGLRILEIKTKEDYSRDIEFLGGFSTPDEDAVQVLDAMRNIREGQIIEISI